MADMFPSILAAGLLLSQVTVPLFRPNATRVLILSGRNNHDWRTTTPFLKRILESTGRFDVRVTEEPEGITARTLAAYHVIVSDYQGPRLGAGAEKALVEFVRGGKGFVAVHAASYAFTGLPVLADRSVRTNIVEPAWPEYAEMVGGVYQEGPPRTGHGRRHVFKVKFTSRDHPIARGLEETFLANDELYHHMNMRPGAKILATAFDALEVNGTGKDEPILWTVDYGKGRVFHTTLGHDVAALMMPGFMATFARGVEWAATGNVTLPAAIELDRKNKDAVRVLLVTGGHDHDGTLYAMFEGQPDIRAAVNPHPIAYNRDLVKQHDVIVLYDMVQEIPEKQKNNLVAFLEGGKGLVVLHHAVADFNDWTWWSEEVVGGKYLLKPQGSRPGSTYKHDVDLQYEVVSDHPITKGLGSLWWRDETYKGMWFSPNIKPLLKTSDPTSDPVVAWISPYQKSRVVVIQPGHDRWAHIHPQYQSLVRRAILWAAGR